MKLEINEGIDKGAFVTAGLLITGIALPISGLISIIERFELQVNQKNIWTSIFYDLAVLLVFFGFFHFIYNHRSPLKSFKNYTIHLFSKELILATVLIFVLVFATVFQSVNI
jgi:uncharacterized membrane protein HdeD (DUF308 family)